MCEKCSTETIVKNKEHEHNHQHAEITLVTISFLILIIGILFDYFFEFEFFQNKIIRFFWYLAAYIPVSVSVYKEAWKELKKASFFNEFTLMAIATIGAFILGEYPEGVAVMLFYSIGEIFQDKAINKAKRNIKNLLGARPDIANVWRGDKYISVHPREVKIGEKIQIKVGEKIPLDGLLLSNSGSFNASALTGESKPSSYKKGEKVLAGMINLDGVIEVETSENYQNSALSRILKLTQEASERKAKTELFIRKFAKIYTPAVFFLAVALCMIPYFFTKDYVFAQWFYRALVFLVIACPCALVISIPLGYFGGIGAGSKNGILFKGSNFLDVIAKINTVVMDKTGTLTKGVFKVQKVVSLNLPENDFLNYLSAIEEKSTHPIAKAIKEFSASTYTATHIKEHSGMGLEGIVNDKKIVAGNTKILKKLNIPYDSILDEIAESVVALAVDEQYSGYVIIADEIKEDAYDAVFQMKENGIKNIMMLSGDKNSIVQSVAKSLNINTAYGDLLPEDKAHKLQELKSEPKNIVAFVGDGINDAPVLAQSDVGIAMGAMGSDIAIETADVVIQNDSPSKIVTAIKIGKETKKIVIQNMLMAFGVKAIVLVLGAGGLATMWEAVFADVGVALLAILNAVRIQNMNFK